MITVAVIGARGLLGRDIVAEGNLRGWRMLTPSRQEADIAASASVERYFEANLPNWIVNCAAFVAVDDAESKSEEAFHLNAGAAEAVARASLGVGARLIHFSTDYVFGGEKTEPYNEGDPTNPLGVYAASKLEGENRIAHVSTDAIIARTAWLYGVGRDNFPFKMLRAAIAGKDLRLVADRVGSPTYTKDLAVAISDIVESSIPGGTYHVVNEGVASWFDLCKEMIEYAGVDVDIQPAKNDEFPTPAARPIYSVLSTQKLQGAGIAELPHWRSAVRRFVDELRVTGAIEA
jgi:dTDP-4-dehydrorhamnose reductase